MGADYTATSQPPTPGTMTPSGKTTATAQAKFPLTLVRWQKKHGRHDLPWQQTDDPYRIWLSEIMLQQTQVQTVIPYYTRFLDAFPTVTALAAAPLEDVLTLWAGLGYYARARNLHACAHKVVDVYGGEFPSDADTLATLPGIGPSTAAAIAVFAFNQRAAILDGNVKRVFCRVFGVEGIPTTRTVDKALWELAATLLPKKDIAEYTQGLMDLGATCCTRSKAHCDICPMAKFCAAFNTDRVNELPHRKPKSTLPVRSSQVWLIRDHDHVWLERRQACGIWGGLLSLPDADTVKLPANATALASTHIRHKFTHFELRAEVLRYQVRTAPVALNRHRELDAYPLSEAEELALPTPWRKLLMAERDQSL
jgi:A/G-specific adenine glycosylase